MSPLFNFQLSFQDPSTFSQIEKYTIFILEDHFLVYS